MIDEDLRDRSGEVIAEKFRLTKRLGAGGMGEVYRAVNEMVGREVAIKILKPEYARSADVVQRVQREARAANKVRHPNIVDVLDVFPDTNGAPVIVQELLVGEDLSSFVRNRGAALSEAEALDLMTPVADALAAAHAAGIMHRDLKLENVFLDRRTGVGVPKVLDFGLSRDIGEAAVSRLTTTGVAMGTPMYMSPEQVQGQRDIDQRTDVWALGVMLYELVAGRLPFEGDSLGAIFVKVCTVDPPPLRTRAPGVSAGYAGIVERCLQRDRANRFEHGGALVAALRAVRGGASSFVSSASAPRLIDARAQTLDAGDDSLGPASAAPVPFTATLAQAPSTPDLRGVLAQSIGPTVSVVPPQQRSAARIVVVAAGLALGVVCAGALLMTRGSSADATNAIAAPLAAEPRSAAPPPGAVVAPAAAAGTAQYDNHPPPPSLPGTAAYDPPATPTPVQPAPIEPAVEPARHAAVEPAGAVEAPTSRRGRRGRPHARPAAGGPHDAPHAGSAHTNAPGGGTTEYDGN